MQRFVNSPPPRSRLALMRRQAGLSLIESLVALVVLALGVMGLAGVQARMLAESRTTNSRAIAMGLIDDMANRILLNRDEAYRGAGYTLPWAANGGATPAAVLNGCTGGSCLAAQLVQSDLNTWRTNVQAALPNADSTIFFSANDPRQIGIAVAWALNEGAAANVGIAVNSAVDGNDANRYNNPFNVTNANSGVVCPPNFICHVMYVQP